jgi:hypothetical protein
MKPTFTVLKSEKGWSNFSGMTYPYRGKRRLAIGISPQEALYFEIWRRSKRVSAISPL